LTKNGLLKKIPFSRPQENKSDNTIEFTLVDLKLDKYIGEYGMKPIEIVEMIKKEKPDFLGKIPEKRAAVIIRESFKQIAAQVEAMEEGQIKVTGFGVFNVKQVERVKEGQKEIIKRIFFRPVQIKAEDAE